jgi:hypothetical protein
MDVVERRLELLKLEGYGLSPPEISKRLSETANCSPRTIYNDFETRQSWQPILQNAVKSGDVVLKVVNRYEQIYRQASMRLLNSPNSLVQLGALNAMLKANSLLLEAATIPQMLDRLRTLEEKAKKGVFVP